MTLPFNTGIIRMQFYDADSFANRMYRWVYGYEFYEMFYCGPFNYYVTPNVTDDFFMKFQEDILRLNLRGTPEAVNYLLTFSFNNSYMDVNDTAWVLEYVEPELIRQNLPPHFTMPIQDWFPVSLSLGEHLIRRFSWEDIDDDPVEVSYAWIGNGPMLNYISNDVLDYRCTHN